MRDLSKNTYSHLGALSKYMSEIRKEQPLKQNYVNIAKHPNFKTFKELFWTSKGVNLAKNKIEEKIVQEFEKINDAYERTMENTIKMIDRRAKQMNDMYKGPSFK